MSIQNSPLIIMSFIDVMNYAKHHFKSEKVYMRKINYPDINEHITMHKEFEAKLSTMYQTVKKDEVIITPEHLKIIKYWILSHIISDDIKLDSFCKRGE